MGSGSCYDNPNISVAQHNKKLFLMPPHSTADCQRWVAQLASALLWEVIQGTTLILPGGFTIFNTWLQGCPVLRPLADQRKREHRGVVTPNCLGPYIGHFQSHPIGKNQSCGSTQTKGSGKCSLRVGPGRGKGSDEHPANLCRGLQAIMRPGSEKTVKTSHSAWSS